MLEQAIVDAKALKEAALKNAEQAVIDKYSSEIKAAVEELLENNEPQEEIIQEEVRAPLAAGPEEGLQEDVDVVLEYEFNPEDFDITINAAKTKEDKEQQAQDNSIEEPAAPPAPAGEETGGDALGGLEGLLEEQLQPEEDDELLNEILALLDEEEDEDLLDESLVVDVDEVKHGHVVTDNSARKYDAELAMAKQESSAYKEEAEELEKQVGELSNSILMYQNKQEKLRTVLDDMKGKLEEMVLQNARLLYSNKVLRDASLNERQKDKIVEAIAKAETLKEAKTLYTTLKETTVGTKSKGPKSLSESVRRKQVLSAHLPRRKQENTTESHDFATRMKKLAGLD
jgi:gas vesicle protein